MEESKIPCHNTQALKQKGSKFASLQHRQSSHVYVYIPYVGGCCIGMQHHTAIYKATASLAMFVQVCCSMQISSF